MSTLPCRAMPPEANRSSPASLVLPAPPGPTRATVLVPTDFSGMIFSFVPLREPPERTRATSLPSTYKATSARGRKCDPARLRSEEHTSELQSLMRISYAVFCLKKKNNSTKPTSNQQYNHTHKKTVPT